MKKIIIRTGKGCSNFKNHRGTSNWLIHTLPVENGSFCNAQRLTALRSVKFQKPYFA